MTGIHTSVSLEWRSVEFRYPFAPTPAVQDCSARWEACCITALAGRSATGKSALGMLLKGLLTPDHGEFRSLSGNYKKPLSSAERMKLVGWAGAHPEMQIFAPTAREEVEFGLKRQGISGDRLRERVEGAMQAVGLSPDDQADSNPFTLSGGWRRLLALASIAAMDYNWFVFDEPTAGLDGRGLRRVGELMQRLKANGCGVLWISHDLAALSRVANRLWLMEEGRITLDVPAADVDWTDLCNRLSGAGLEV